MMLQALIAYAEREGLGDADFGKVGVRWLVPIDEVGQFATTLIPLTDDPLAKKLRPKRLVRPKSDPDFVAHGKSYFLCDTLERSLLFVDDPANLKKRRVNQAYFVSLLEDAAKACPKSAASLRSLVMFLRNPAELARVHSAFLKAKAKGSDNAVFSVNGLDLLKSEELHNYWRARSTEERGKQDAENGVCLATGKLGPICRTTGFIKLLGEDTKLISFNKECPAFESFGLSQAGNAPVGVDAEVKFRAAFNKLIEISYEQRLVFGGKNNKTIHLHWTRQAVDFDPLDPVVSGDPNAIARLLHSVQDGHQVEGLDANAYYALSLSSNGTRIVVRDWLESTVPEIARNMWRWFSDICIIDPDGVVLRQNFSLWSLLAATLPRKEGRPDFEKLSPQTAAELLFSALRLMPLPQTALAAALRRQNIEHRKPDDKFDPKLNPARMALIKACLLRSPNKKETDTMTERLDPESKDCAYLCGQLFAVIGRLQLIALGKIGASLADRTYGGVATRPATTFGPVFTKLPPYLKKANTRFPGSGTNKQKEIESLCARIEKLGGIQKTLNLEEQGRFALGYYCQLAQYRTDRAEADAAEKAQELQEDAS